MEKQIDIARPFAMMGEMVGGFLHTMGNKLNNAYSSLSRLNDTHLSADQRSGKLMELREDLDTIKGISSFNAAGYTCWDVCRGTDSLGV